MHSGSFQEGFIIILWDYYHFELLITPAKEVMCLIVSKITQKLINVSFWNFCLYSDWLKVILFW